MPQELASCLYVKVFVSCCWGGGDCSCLSLSWENIVPQQLAFCLYGKVFVGERVICSFFFFFYHCRGRAVCPNDLHSAFILKYLLSGFVSQELASCLYF